MNSKNPTNIANSKITLRPVKLGDAHFLVQMMDDEDYKKYYPERLILDSIEKAEQEVKKAIRSKKRGLGNFFILETKLKNKNKRIGLINIYKINKNDSRASVGYGVLKEFQGKGIATQAGKVALKFMKQKLKLHACEATTHPHHKASVRVLEKLGFHKVGLMKDYHKNSNGKYQDRELYWKIL